MGDKVHYFQSVMLTANRRPVTEIETARSTAWLIQSEFLIIIVIKIINWDQYKQFRLF